jgi:GNAT superfamily N-acetyltransferase
VTLLDTLETYLDAVPRAHADVEDVGPFSLFVARRGWPYYARPRLGGRGTVTAADVEALIDAQDSLGLPRKIEWVHETTPELSAAASAAGLIVEHHALLVLDGDPMVRTTQAVLKRMKADDPDLLGVQAAIAVGFANPGTGIGASSLEARDAAVASLGHAGHMAAQIASGRTVMVGAINDVAGPVGGGSYNPCAGVAEIVGVGVLPAYRRRGIAGALTSFLARHALDADCRTVFCSADDDDVARVYAASGFRRVGTACAADFPNT